LRSFRHRLRRFAGLTGGRRALLVEAVFWLALARLAVRSLPFRLLSRHLGAFTAPDEGLTLANPVDPPAGHVRLAGEIGWAVTRAARHVPFDAVCLPQAMAAQQMLRRRGVRSTLYFGVSKGSIGAVESHAWLRAAGVEVTGYPIPDGFSPIACYV